MRLRSCLLALLLCALAPGAVAAAASPPGTLAQLAGAGGCASTQAALGCTPARGLDDARAVALSPDGLSLYVAAATPASVTAFSVAPGNGLLQQLNLGAGCLASIAQDGCGARARARGRLGDRRLARQPARLRRVRDGGSRDELRPPAERIARAARGRRRLHLDHAGRGLLPARTLAGRRRRDRDLARRPLRLRRGRHGRLAARVLARRGDRAPDAARRHGGLPARQPHRLRARSRASTAPSAIAIAPDGTSLYVASSAGTLTSFQRDVTTGSADAAAPRRRLPERRRRSPAARAVGGLARASAVAITPDGHTLIAAGTDDDAVVSFRRDPATRRPHARRRASPAPPPRRAARPRPLIGGPRGARRAPQRAARSGSRPPAADSIVTLQIDPTTGRADADAPAPAAACGGWPRRTAARRARSTTRAGSPSSADGSHVYAVSAQSDGIAVLGPQLAPNCLRVRATTVANKAHSVVLACSDPNGDKIALTIGSQPQARRA